MQHALVQKQPNQRNYGIDALRLLAMFFVTILHTLGHGGVLSNTVGIKNDAAYLIEIIAYCAVNCYAIISGFVMYSEEEKPYRYSKYITMWLQVFFYSFGIGLLTFIIKGNDAVSFKELIKFALPVTTKRYWYFSAYTGLFFVAPFLNKLMRSLSKKQTTGFVLLLFAATFFSLIVDIFALSSGYSLAWLVVMYIFGAWLKKCYVAQKLKSRFAVAALIACTLLTWGFKILSPFAENIFITYLSPTIVLSSLCWVVIFSKFNIKSVAKNIIKFLSPAAFGVYLIHEQAYIRDNFITQRFIWITDFTWWLIPIISIGCALSIFVVCLCIEKVRQVLFNLLQINTRAEKVFFKIETFLKKRLNSLLERVF